MENNCNEIANVIVEDCGSITEDYLEMGIDLLMDEGVLKEIPIVKTVYALIKTPVSLWKAYNMKKLIYFCYYMKEIPKFERIKFVNKAVYKDKHFGEKLLLVIDKIDELDKIRMLLLIFRAYGHRYGISYDEFRQLCLCLENAYIGDLNCIKQYVESGKEYFGGESAIRLSNVGLTAMTIIGGDILNGDVFQMLPLGQTFYDCVFSNKYEVIN